MSPSEFDLRAALHDGEDDARLDVDHVVAGARGRLAQRRVRVLSAAAAVVVVAGAGVAAASIRGGGSAPRAGSGSPSSRGSAAPTPAATRPTPHRAAGASTPARACPETYPQVLLPGGGSPGQFGSDGAMFAKPVATLFVCGYGSGFTPGTVVPAVRVYTGSSAAALAASIEKAARTPPAERCPAIVLASQNRLVLAALATDGSRERVVTTTLTVPTCGVRLTNGTAIRYAWQPPGEYEAQLLALRPAPAGASGTTGPSAASGSGAGSAVAPAPAGSPSSSPRASLLPVGPSRPLNGSPVR